MARRFAIACRVVAIAAVALGSSASIARPHRRPPVLVALAPATDVREAVAIGPAGQVYAPDGHGAWVRAQAVTTADRLDRAGRAGALVVAAGGGAIYRLAANGWSALRLAQKGKAVMSAGPRAVGAVGRQLYALDRLDGGEPAKLARAPADVTQIGASRQGIVIATDRGLLRVDGSRVTPIKKAPRRVRQLITDRWALVDRGALDLRTLKTTAWPDGVKIGAAVAGAGDSLVGIGASRGGLELVTVARGGKVGRDALPDSIRGTAVDLVVDGRGRVVLAFEDGRLAIRDRGTWSVVEVREALPPPRPGAPPATSP